MRNDKRLKIHIEEEPKEESVAVRLHNQLPVAKTLCSQFEELTGWVVNYDLPGNQQPKEGQSLWGQFEIIDLSEKIGAGKSAIHRGKCEQLLDSVNELVNQLKQSQQSIELGGDGYRFFDFHLEPNKSDVLAAQLLDVAKSLNAEAAALYLLDEETTQLRIRACVGGNQKPKQLAATRPLEHSLADLEALVGNVVQVNRQEISPAWNLPEPYENGACITVGSDGMPLGTMWVFFENESEMSPQQLGMLEQVAQQIGKELVSRKKPADPNGELPQIEQEIRNASRINDSRLPQFSPEIDGWKISGWTYRKDRLTGNFHDWAMTPSGGLSISLGQVTGASIPASINANNLRSLICAHRDYRHDAKKMVEKLNENIWTNSPGDELAALIYSVVDPETGQVQIVNAGDGGVVLLDGSKPVSIDQFQDPLGLEMESNYVQWEGVLGESQSIIMFSQGLRTAFCELTAAVDDADLFGNIFEDCQNEPDLILAAIQDLFFQSDFQLDAPDLSVVVLTKKQPPQATYYYGRIEESVGAENARGALPVDSDKVEQSFHAFLEAIEVGDVDWQNPAIDTPGEDQGSQKEGQHKDQNDSSNDLDRSPDSETPDEGSGTEKEPNPEKKKIVHPKPALKKAAPKKATKKAAPRKTAKKTVAKKSSTAAKKRTTGTTAKKSETKKSGVKKSASKTTAKRTVKRASKKSSTKKTSPKRSTAKKATVKRATKSASKKAVKKTTARKSATKKVVSKKAVKTSSRKKSATTTARKTATPKKAVKKQARKKPTVSRKNGTLSAASNSVRSTKTKKATKKKASTRTSAKKS